ncbi:MAG: hypothetical protein OXG87_18105 [Gemmatimonadetes bacterium]|nr:hypothetical protein [Gemmatimonadota bacterium]
MSAVALNNRVTSDSNSDAVFASCTILPIHQTTLNVKEMADIDGQGGVADTIDAAIDYISDVVDSVGDYVSEAATTARIALTGSGTTYHDLDPDPFGFPTAPKRELKIITQEIHSCNQPVVYSTYGTCLCKGPPRKW